MELGTEIKTKMDKIRSYFPTAQALLLPLLHAIQEKDGWISDEALQAAADYLHLPLARVEEVVTFYTMYNRKPVGKNHLQLCVNISCWLNGSDRLLECIEKRLHVHCGETTKDGKFTLSEVECLASCGTAPVMQVNEDYHEGLNEKTLNELLDRLEKGRST